MQHIISYTFVSGLVALSLAGCADFKVSPRFNSWMLDQEPPPGPPEYQQGWMDGCQSALSGFGNQLYKQFYSFKQDVTLVSNPVYYQVWKDAYAYCRTFSMMQTNHGLGNGAHPW